MELVEVEIIGQAITAQYGTLNTGDILRTDAAFAKHLVEDCGAAKYRKASVDPAATLIDTKKPRQKTKAPDPVDPPPAD